jgi:hypothetical protein
MKVMRVQNEIVPVTVPNYEQKSLQLSRHEKLKLRNQVIILKLSTGLSKEAICDEYSIGQRQLTGLKKDIKKRIWLNNLSSIEDLEINVSVPICMNYYEKGLLNPPQKVDDLLGDASSLLFQAENETSDQNCIKEAQQDNTEIDKLLQ